MLRSGDYSKPCDVWAVGCILGELLNKGRPILPGQNEVDQFRKICDLIGKPTTRDEWPDYFKLANYEEYQRLSDNCR